MAGQEKIRINKVLKEFNIGLGTLVEFLSKKGYEVEANPGAQISGEEYELVKKEYAKEQLIKEESKKIAIKVKEITKKESPRQEPEEEPFGEEVIIKTTTIGHPSTPEPAITEKKTEISHKDEQPLNSRPAAELEKETETPHTEDVKPESVQPAAAEAEVEPKPEISTGTAAESRPDVKDNREKDEHQKGLKILGKMDLNKNRLRHLPENLKEQTPPGRSKRNRSLQFLGQQYLSQLRKSPAGTSLSISRHG